MNSSMENGVGSLGDGSLYSSITNKLIAGFVLTVILFSSLIPYRTLWGRGFSDTDDFHEVYRAVAVDIPNPSQIFLTTHFGTFYRPVSRLLTAITTYWGGASAEPFLAQNLAFHLLSIVFVFYIVLSLTSNLYTAALAACLFAFHPANVNAVSVAVFTQSFGLVLILWAVYILINLKVAQRRSYWFKLAFVALLLGITTFAYEMFFWVLPTYATYLTWRFIYKGRKNKTYLVIAGMAVLVMFIYLTIRQSVVQEGIIVVAQSISGRIGLKSPDQILRNLALFAVSTGNVLDYLRFFNPVDEMVPTTLPALLAPGLLASLVLNLAVAAITIVVSLVRFVLAPKRETALPLVFVILSLLYVSVVSVMTLASDTYLDGAIAFFSIAQSLVLFDLFQSISLDWQYGKVVRWSVALLLIAIVLIRAVGVDYRNNILSDKATRIGYLQSELRRVTAGFMGDKIAFISPCAPPSGYSVYGGRGMMLVVGSETPFVQLTLNSTRILVGRSDPDSLEAGRLKDSETLMNLVVDNQGKMYHVNELSNPVDVCK